MAKQVDPFAEHVPTEAQAAAVASWRECVRAAAIAIREHAHPSRYQSLAVTALEEALSWGEKAIFQRDD